MYVVLKRMGSQETVQVLLPEENWVSAALTAGVEYARHIGGGPLRIYTEDGEPVGVVTVAAVETEQEMEDLGAGSDRHSHQLHREFIARCEREAGAV